MMIRKDLEPMDGENSVMADQFDSRSSKVFELQFQGVKCMIVCMADISLYPSLTT